MIMNSFEVDLQKISEHTFQKHINHTHVSLLLIISSSLLVNITDIVITVSLIITTI